MRALAFILGWVAWGLAATGPARAEPVPELLEFPEVFNQTRVFAPLVSPGGCVLRKGESLPTELKTLACEPDPSQEICRLADGRVRARARAIQAEMDRYSLELSALYQKAKLEAAQRLGAVPPKAEAAKLREYALRYWKIVNARVEAERKPIDDAIRKRTEGSRAVVEERVRRVRDAMVATVRQAAHLGDDRPVIEQILGCRLHLRLELDQSQLDDNAFISSNFDPEGSLSSFRDALATQDQFKLSHTRGRRLDRAEEASLVINPLAESVTDCHLSLTPRFWIGCEQSEGICTQLLMHEFGHVLHSCYLEDLANRAEARARAADGPDRTRLDFLARQAHRVARTLFERTACLEGLTPGNLHAGVPNACVESLPKAGSIEERCQKNSVPGFPGQWVEAEADLWGASGMATWLEKNYAAGPARARAVYDTWANFCQNEQERGQVEDRAVPPGERARVRALDEGVTGEAALKAPPPGCAANPLRPNALKAWNDPHQDWHLRVNRNFLRNSDLRRALDCGRSRQPVPMACSPVN